MASKRPSQRWVIASSFAALMVFTWGVLLDWHFVLGEWELTIGQVGIAALLYAAIISGWIWALVASKGESQRANYVLLVYAGLLCAYALQDLFVYCPNTCSEIWLYYVANWGNLVSGIASAAAIVMKFRRASAI